MAVQAHQNSGYPSCNDLYHDGSYDQQQLDVVIGGAGQQTA